ncbi:hypothetical protein GCM10009122_14290 [Fulvivirga kasyanovii]|uniref:hypothetical protein n=1 Tax=Fulvivirga kasyanovii TaxID=396812 RepID=UPI0031DAB9A4
MFWRKKIEDPKKGDLTKLERSIFDYLISKLPEPQSWLIKEQLKYLTLIKRVEYQNDVVTEMYPEQYGIIPQELLFGRTEEFRLAYIKYRIGEVKYTSEIHMVMGQVFDVKIRPKPPKEDVLRVNFLEAKIDDELERNIY